MLGYAIKLGQGMVVLSGLLILLWWWESRFDRPLAALYRSQRINPAKHKGHWKALQ